MKIFFLCHEKLAFTRDKIKKMSTPQTPQSNVKFHRNSKKNKGQRVTINPICQKKGKTSYHLTGELYKENSIKKLGAGRIKKNILPEVTQVTGESSYRNKIILPEITI